jgi:hypothetical protein
LTIQIGQKAKDKKQKSVCHPRVVWMVSRGWFNCGAYGILLCSKFIVGYYVIICAIYLARLIKHLLKVSGPGRKRSPENQYFQG